MQSKMIVRRTQYAVGQGGFHVGELHTNDKKFRYIYDCGSRNPSSINSILKSWPSDDKKFDWLVVSSFDSDHFNGVKLLLDNGFTFEVIVLPHLLDEELFRQIFFYYAARGVDGDEISTIAEVFHGILAGKFGRIVPTRLDELPGELSKFNDAIDTKKLILKSKGRVSEISYRFSDADWMLRFYSVEAVNKGVIEDIFNHPCLIPLRESIESISKSLHAKIPFDELKKLIETLNEKLSSRYKKPDVLPSAPDATPINKPDENDVYVGKKLKEILGKECRPAGKRSVVYDYNSASLCLYSGPIPEPHENFNTNFNCNRTVNYQRLSNELPKVQESRVVGWIGVGDITFKDADSLKDFIRHFSAEITLAGTRMLPHHGAQSNYDDNLSLLNSYAMIIPSGSMWVAAANPLGGYRHPDGSVVAGVRATGHFHLVDDEPQTTLQEVITYRPSLHPLIYELMSL